MEIPRRATLKNNFSGPDADGVEVTFYTDPLCCWSWAMAPAWDRLLLEYGTRIKVSYRMGGLLPSWEHYEDATHSISRPSQMGPEWMHAAELSGVRINSGVWITDPPASSYPACIAMKAVQLQSERFAGKFLQLLKRAVMVDGRNIAKTHILLDISWQLYDEYRDFNLFRYRADLMGNAGREAFATDLQEAKYLGINRFPTLVVRREDGSKVMITGYQTYESLRSCLDIDQQAL